MTPLPNPHMPDGQLPEAREPDLLRLKCSILAMIFFAFGRAVCAIALGAGAGSFDFSALPNMFLNIVMGTFLLKDDQHLRGFYKCLSETIGQVCADFGEGGMQCLIPFMLMTLVNVKRPVRFHPANGIPRDYAIWNLPSWIHHLSGICSVFCMLHLQADSGASRRDGDGRLR